MLHPMTIQASCRSPAVYGTSSPCLLLATASWPTPGHLGNATAPMKLQLSKRPKERMAGKPPSPAQARIAAACIDFWGGFTTFCSMSSDVVSCRQLRFVQFSRREQSHRVGVLHQPLAPGTMHCIGSYVSCGRGSERPFSCASFCRGLHNPFVKHSFSTCLNT